MNTFNSFQELQAGQLACQSEMSVFNALDSLPTERDAYNDAISRAKMALHEAWEIIAKQTLHDAIAKNPEDKKTVKRTIDELSRAMNAKLHIW